MATPEFSPLNTILQFDLNLRESLSKNVEKCDKLIKNALKFNNHQAVKIIEGLKEIALNNLNPRVEVSDLELMRKIIDALDEVEISYEKGRKDSEIPEGCSVDPCPFGTYISSPNYVSLNLTLMTKLFNNIITDATADLITSYDDLVKNVVQKNT